MVRREAGTVKDGEHGLEEVEQVGGDGGSFVIALDIEMALWVWSGGEGIAGVDGGFPGVGEGVEVRVRVEVDFAQGEGEIVRFAFVMADGKKADGMRVGEGLVLVQRRAHLSASCILGDWSRWGTVMLRCKIDVELKFAGRPPRCNLACCRSAGQCGVGEVGPYADLMSTPNRCHRDSEQVVVKVGRSCQEQQMK